jgi:hypothetical protein
MPELLRGWIGRSWSLAARASSGEDATPGGRGVGRIHTAEAKVQRKDDRYLEADARISECRRRSAVWV